MDFTHENLVAVRDKVHSNIPKVLEANKVAGRDGGENQWDYCVVHSDGTALGSEIYTRPACHRALCNLQVYTRSKCIRKGISVPVAVIQSIPNIEHFDSEEDRRYWVEYNILHSPFSDMFLLKDVQTTLEQGFVIRTDVHPDWVMRTCSYLRKVEEHSRCTLALLGNRGKDIPPSTAMLLGAFLNPLYVSSQGGAHNFTGIYSSYIIFKKLPGFIAAYERYIRDSILTSAPDLTRSYMCKKEEVQGWISRLVEEFQEFLSSDDSARVPQKYMKKDPNSFQGGYRIPNNDVAEAAFKIYEGEFK